MAELAVSTWPQVERSAPLTLVVPLGSLEQHGPHLPLATDTLIASYVASAIAREIPRCALAPAISIGASGEHAGFAGTLSIGTDALTTLLIELSRDASREYERVVLVNGHGGTDPRSQLHKRSAVQSHACWTSRTAISPVPTHTRAAPRRRFCYTSRPSSCDSI